jgi:hypothetical protein
MLRKFFVSSASLLFHLEMKGRCNALSLTVQRTSKTGAQAAQAGGYITDLHSFLTRLLYVQLSRRQV